MNSIWTQLEKVIFFAIVLVACSGSTAPETSQVQQSETSTATLAPTATATLTPTPQPTPIGGSNSIVLAAPFELYKDTHPELGEGQHLFLLDTADGSLTPITESIAKYNRLTGFSPDRRFLTIGSANETTCSRILGQTFCDFSNEIVTLMDMATGETTTLPGSEPGSGHCGLNNSSWCQSYPNAWLSNQMFAYLGPDDQGVRRIYTIDPVSKESVPITPEGKNIDSFSVVSPEGPFFWQAHQGNRITGIYQTEISGKTVELEINYDDEVGEGFAFGQGKWISQFYSTNEAFLRLRLPGDDTWHTAKELFGDELPQGFRVQIQEWSSNYDLLLLNTFARSNNYLGSFIWNISESSLVEFPVKVFSPESRGSATFTPDGQYILVTIMPWGPNESLILAETKLQIYSTEDGLLVSELSAPWADFIYYTASFSPDGKMVLFFSQMHEPVILNLESLDYEPLKFPESWLSYYRDESQSGKTSLESIWIP